MFLNTFEDPCGPSWCHAPALITESSGLERTCLKCQNAALLYVLQASHSVLRYCEKSSTDMERLLQNVLYCICGVTHFVMLLY